MVRGLCYLCRMNDHPVILFDGVCNFCNGAINFVIKRDRKRCFRFAPLQSDAGRRLLAQYGLSTTDFNSFILIQDGKYLQKSTAALQVYTQLGGARKLAGIGYLIPRFIRDFFYSLIARNRYKWFGKKQACMIPTPETKSLFLQ